MAGGYPFSSLELPATFSLQSLTGHTSPVESVRLNTPEELIVAGSQSGSIRVWDLEAAKSRSPSFLSFVCGSYFRLGALGCHLQEVWVLCSLNTEQSGWCYPYHVINPAAVGQLLTRDVQGMKSKVCVHVHTCIENPEGCQILGGSLQDM